MLTTSYAVLKQAGNGAIVAFSGSWKIQAASDLQVYKIDANGAQSGLLVITTDYTVTFDTVAETFTVTYVVAPVNGGYSLIKRLSDNTQQTLFPREGAAPAKATEAALDKLQAQIQELLVTQAAIQLSVTPTMLSGSYAVMNAIALLNPTVPFQAVITDYKMIGTYTGNVLLGTSGWWFSPGGS